MICRIVRQTPSGDIVLYTRHVTKYMIRHLKTNARYQGKGFWIYDTGKQRLLLAVERHLGLDMKTLIKKQLTTLGVLL